MSRISVKKLSLILVMFVVISLIFTIAFTNSQEAFAYNLNSYSIQEIENDNTSSTSYNIFNMYSDDASSAGKADFLYGASYLTTKTSTSGETTGYKGTDLSSAYNIEDESTFYLNYDQTAMNKNTASVVLDSSIFKYTIGDAAALEALAAGKLYIKIECNYLKFWSGLSYSTSSSAYDSKISDTAYLSCNGFNNETYLEDNDYMMGSTDTDSFATSDNGTDNGAAIEGIYQVTGSIISLDYYALVTKAYSALQTRRLYVAFSTSMRVTLIYDSSYVSYTASTGGSVSATTENGYLNLTDTDTIETASTATATADSGYSFLGWYDDANGTTCTTNKVELGYVCNLTEDRYTYRAIFYQFVFDTSDENSHDISNGITTYHYTYSSSAEGPTVSLLGGDINTISYATLTCWYSGTDAGGNDYSESVAPTDAGSYTLTATVTINNTDISATEKISFEIDKLTATADVYDSLQDLWYGETIYESLPTATSSTSEAQGFVDDFGYVMYNDTNASYTYASGSWAFEYADGTAFSDSTVLEVGTHTINYVFTPTNTTSLNVYNTTLTFTVKQATYTSSTTPTIAYTYGDSVSAANISNYAFYNYYNSSLAVAGVWSAIGDFDYNLGAGTTTLSFVFTPTDTKNYAETTASVAATVSKATLTASLNSGAIEYGTALPSIIIDYSGFVNGETIDTISGFVAPTATSTGDSLSNVGTYITISISGGSADNYIIDVSGSASVVITQTTPILSASYAYSYVGDDISEVTVSASGISGGTDAKGDVTYKIGTYDGTTFTEISDWRSINAGYYSVQVAYLQTSTSDNYKTYTEVFEDVYHYVAKEVVITLTIDYTYDGNAVTIRDYVEVGGAEGYLEPVGDWTVECYDNASATGDPVSVLNAGTYYAEVSYEGKGNYADSTEIIEFEIKQIESTLTFTSDLSVEYSASTPTTTAEAKDSEGGVIAGTMAILYSLNGEDWAETCSSVDVGDYYVKATFTPDSTNYAAASITESLTITKAPLAVTFNNVDVEIMYYSGLIASFTVDEVTGWKSDNDIVDISIKYIVKGSYTKEDAGTVCEVVITINTSLANYSFEEYYAGTITVVAGEVYLKYTDNTAGTFTYNGYPQETTAKVEGAGSEPTGATVFEYSVDGSDWTSTAPTNVGVYYVRATYTADIYNAGNYKDMTIDSTYMLTISAATLTVSFNEADHEVSAYYGAESEPVFSLSYIGFVGTDTIALITTKYTYSLGQYSRYSDTGEYYATINTNDEMSLANYVIDTSATVSFWVVATDAVITLDEYNTTYNGRTVSVSATVSGILGG
ncbi:MAG: MBG domain-containing protein [Bacillota bacterium]